jgi:hypothetical protein
MKPSNFKSGGSRSLVDLSKKPYRRERIAPASGVRTRKLIDFGKRPESHAIRRVPLSESSRSTIQTAVFLLGLATFGLLLWAFSVGRVPVVVRAPATTIQAERPKPDPAKMWTADESPRLGVAVEPEQHGDMPADFLQDIATKEPAQAAPNLVTPEEKN